MKIAVKFQSQNNHNPDGIPSYWPWKQLNIKDDEVETYQGFDWTVYTKEEYVQYLADHQADFDVWFNNRLIQANSTRLKVLGLVQNDFLNYHPSKIDFTIHLKPNIVLNKKTTMLRNGRPEKAEYYYGEEKICEIKFEFTVNSQNFMTSRSEKLGYVRGDGSIGEYFTIYSKTFDATNFADKAAVTEERSSARQYIMKEIKSVLNDVLGLYYIVLPPVEQKKTIAELYQLAGVFWSAYSSDIDSWYNTATGDFKTKILAEAGYPFLDFVVPPQISQEAEAKTVRQYIADRITY